MPSGVVVWGKWGLKHGKWQYKVDDDLSKVKKLDLHKYGGNV